MTWTIETIEKFFESKKSNPYEFDRLCREDPTCRLWSGMKKAERNFIEAKQERQAIGTADFSINPARTAELEAVMTASLERREKALSGLQQACSLLGCHPEPSCRALQSRAAYLRRTRQGGEAVSLESLCTNLEQIALVAGV